MKKATKTNATNATENTESTGTELAQLQPNGLPIGVTMTTPDALQDNEGWESRGLPPIIKPAIMPIGGMIQGSITDIVPSGQKSIKNPLMYLDVETPNGNARVAFPVTAVIMSAFAQDNEDMQKMLRDDKQIPVEDLQEFVGYDIRLIKIGKGKSNKGPKGTHLFQVFLRNSK